MNGPALSPETGALVSTLNGQRRHVLGILEGLSDDDLRRPVLPSGWTCVGLVRHLALDVERLWFRTVMAGQPEDADIPGQAEEPGTDAWEVGPGVRPQAVLDLYRREIELADAVITVTPIDAPPAWWPEEQFGSWRLADLRATLLHVIAETACHAGHLDAVRELIDGRMWLDIR
jgi:Protein of unknown function (DUF664)